MICKYEHTDTYGGEANYSWVERGEFKMPDTAKNRDIVKRAKELTGLTGVKCNTEDFGDMIKITPRNICQVVFITFK